MNYIIFDLEHNQDMRSKKDKANDETFRIPFEIIQIGAVKLDNNFNTISNFNRLIKPVIYTELHPFIKKLTGISKDQLDTADSFLEVYNDFVEFANDEDCVLCVWGMSDIKELYRNIKYHKLNTEILPKEYINIQAYASQLLHCPKGTSIGLSNAVKLLNIETKDDFHDAFNDAYYTGEVFKKIPKEPIEIKTYNPDDIAQKTRQLSKRTSVDFDKLLSQFEKMFYRKMTEEEKSIIKLAYMMGRTNQFVKENDTE